MKKKFGVGKSYADILTILLVIIVIAIISLLGFFTYKIINEKTIEADAADANSDFLAAAEENKKLIQSSKKKEEEEVEVPTEIDYDKLNSVLGNHNSGETSELPDEQEGQTQTQPSETTTEVPENVEIKKQYLGNYEIKGSISIPKTNCNYPILEKVTVDSLNKSIALMDIASNPELNRVVKDLNVPGTNAYIMGHNYKNGKFFSNNDKLAIGDKIKITDQIGNQVTYTIYDMFYTEPDDVSFMYRTIDVNTRELSLQTCNENSSKRLIILAKDN